MTESYRVRGWRYHTRREEAHQVGAYKGVPADGLAAVMRSLLREGAVYATIEAESALAEAEDIAWLNDKDDPEFRAAMRAAEDGPAEPWP